MMVNDIEEWTPKTKLGRLVQEGKISSMGEMFRSGLPLMEYEVIDVLLPDTVEEVLDINIVQRMHKSGRRIRFRATVAVGNNDGYVGLGKGTAKEVGPAIRKGIKDAKITILNRSHEHAEFLAEVYGATLGDMDALGKHICDAEVVISSTGSQQPIIDTELVRSSLAGRARALLLVD